MMWKALAIAAVIAAAIAFPLVVTVNYFLHLAILALIFVMVAQGANVIQGYTGYVSIAQGAFMGIGAYSSALLSMRLGLPVWASMAVAPLLTALAALIAGYPSLRVKGHYFAIVTLAMNMVVFIVLVNWISLTKGEPGLPSIPSPEPINLGFVELAFEKRRPYYYLTLTMLVAVMAVVTLVVRSRVGQILLAIRQNEAFAEAAGIACWKYKLFAFVFSASLAGLAGALYAHYMGFINPTPFSAEASLNAILAVILGGSGTLTGPLLGGALTVLLPEVLRVAEVYRLIAYGFILILVVIFLPRGLVPALTDFAARLFRGGRGGQPA